MKKSNTYWNAIIEHTLDIEYNSIKIFKARSLELIPGIKKGIHYYLIFDAQFKIEIVKVISVLPEGILFLERGQMHTPTHIWPAGTLLSSKISKKHLKQLKLDVKSFTEKNNNGFIDQNGDYITKIYT